MKKEILYIIPMIIATGFLFLSPLAVSNLLFDGLITAKMMAVEKAAIPVAIITAMGLILKNSIRITTADILVVSFVVWCALTEIFIHNGIESFSPTLVYSYILWTVIWLAFRIIATNPVSITIIPPVWIGVTLIIAVMGLLQLYGIIPSKHNLFSITGPFHNPGPFSGWIVAALPLSLSYVIELYGNRSEVNTEFRIVKLLKKKVLIAVSPDWYIRHFILTLSVVTMATIVLVLPPAASRSSWIAGAVASFFVIMNHKRLRSWRKSILTRVRNIGTGAIILIASGMLILLLSSAFALYSLKRESVDGRLLIWKVTTTLIGEKPLTGHGTGSFARDYMQAQAEWFSSGRGTQSEIDRAGSPNYAFNELLELLLEKGLIAVAVSLLCIYFLLHPRLTRSGNPPPSSYSEKGFGEQLDGATITGLKGALVANLTFSIFSYPFSLSPFVLQIVAATAMLAALSQQVFILRTPVKGIIVVPLALLMLLLPFIFYSQRKDYYTALKEWREAHRLYSIKAYDASILKYEKALTFLNDDGLFLQMYGKALSQAGDYRRSNEVLDNAGKYFSSQIISLTLGDNHRALGNVGQAEVAYMNAQNMIPGMLYPRYQRFMLLTESGQKDRASEVAEDILSMDIRIESTATRQMLDEVKRINENPDNDE
jgi:O-antigen polymerase